MKSITIMLSVILVCAGTAVAGEYQRYVDENGVVRYSDGLTDVPKNRRQTLTTHDTPDRAPTGDAVPATPPAATQATAPDAASAPAAPAAAPVLSGDASISEVKAALDVEHAKLLAEKTQLDQALADGFSTPEESREYHDRVSALNQRIAAFEQRRTALNQRVNDNIAKKEAAKRAEARKRKP